MTHMPALLTAIFIAALVSALMSTSDSSLLAGASAVTENLIPLITGKKLDGKKALWATRIMVLVNAVVGLAIALWSQTVPSYLLSPGRCSWWASSRRLHLAVCSAAMNSRGKCSIHRRFHCMDPGNHLLL